MTRRLTLAILGTTVAALLLAGLVTLLLARITTRWSNERDLRRSAQALAQNVGDVADRPRPGLLAVIRGALRLEGAELLLTGPAGNINGRIPAGVSRADLDLPALGRGQTVSGANGDLIYAAAPADSTRGTVVAVLTRRVSGFGPATGWF